VCLFDFLTRTITLYITIIAKIVIIALVAVNKGNGICAGHSITFCPFLQLGGLAPVPLQFAVQLYVKNPLSHEFPAVWAKLIVHVPTEAV
jgi:hypothetical protein